MVKCELCDASYEFVQEKLAEIAERAKDMPKPEEKPEKKHFLIHQIGMTWPMVIEAKDQAEAVEIYGCEVILTCRNGVSSVPANETEIFVAELTQKPVKVQVLAELSFKVV